MKKHLQKFDKLFDFGHKRPYKNGIEIRVQNLEHAEAEAKKIIEDNNLNLEIRRDVSLRSISIFPKEIIKDKT